MTRALILVSLLAAIAPAQAADPQLARNLAATCANCHGTDGQTVADGGMARLAGRHAEDTLSVLAEFKNGQRPATLMHQIVKGYTDEQLTLIAHYFAAQK